MGAKKVSNNKTDLQGHSKVPFDGPYRIFPIRLPFSPLQPRFYLAPFPTY